MEIHGNPFQRPAGNRISQLEANGKNVPAGLQHKLELRAVDNLEPLDVAAMQRGVLIAVDVGVEERVTLDVHLAV